MSELDLIIIGAGPAGYVAAIRAGQLGMKTAIVERSKLGGMCLNWGCIPSKTLMESAKLYDKTLGAKSFGIEGIDKKTVTFNWEKAVGRKDRIVTRLVKGVEYLMKKNKVEIVRGEATILEPGKVKAGDAELKVKNIIIATGSSPATDALAKLDSDMVMQIGELFAAKNIGEKFVVYGSSPYACETAFMLRLLGKKVTMVSPDKMLLPGLDSDLSKFVTEKFTKSGIQMLFEQTITGQGENGVQVGNESVECDAVINCADREAVLPEVKSAELELKDGFVSVDEYLQTSVSGIYAVGDVTGQITAHAGSAQGIAAVNHMAGVMEPIDYNKIPRNIYLAPEIASVGLTEDQIKESGDEYSRGIFPLSVNGKAMAEGETDGFVKVLAEKKYGEVLGVHIVAPNATDMISEAVAIMQLEGTLEDVGRIVHAHPTVSETIVEASLVAMDEPRHI